MYVLKIYLLRFRAFPKAMTQMLGLICVVQYTFAATALEILGRQNAPGFVSWHLTSSGFAL